MSALLTSATASVMDALSLPSAGVAGQPSAVAHALVVSVPSVSVSPNPNLPGTPQLSQLIGGLMTWVLLACVASVLIGAAAWGFGSRAGHYASSQHGRQMCLGGAVGALVAGAAVAVVNFAFGVGGTVH